MRNGGPEVSAVRVRQATKKWGKNAYFQHFRAKHHREKQKLANGPRSFLGGQLGPSGTHGAVFDQQNTPRRSGPTDPGCKTACTAHCRMRSGAQVTAGFQAGPGALSCQMGPPFAEEFTATRAGGPAYAHMEALACGPRRRV